jgi:hypothetical protein
MIVKRTYEVTVEVQISNEYDKEAKDIENHWLSHDVIKVKNLTEQRQIVYQKTTIQEVNYGETKKVIS